MVCEILISQPGIEPVSPAMETVLTTGSPGKSLTFLAKLAFLLKIYICFLGY